MKLEELDINTENNYKIILKMYCWDDESIDYELSSNLEKDKLKDWSVHQTIDYVISQNENNIEKKKLCQEIKEFTEQNLDYKVYIFGNHLGIIENDINEILIDERNVSIVKKYFWTKTTTKEKNKEIENYSSIIKIKPRRDN